LKEARAKYQKQQAERQRKQALEAKRRVEKDKEDCEKAGKYDTRKDWEAYLSNHPRGMCKEKAEKRISEIRREEARTAEKAERVEEARKVEETRIAEKAERAEEDRKLEEERRSKQSRRAEEVRRRYFPHSHSGLRWWSSPAPNRMNHSNAIKYCRDMGGRLPTISELRTLIQNCHSTQSGDCSITDNCLLTRCFNDACNGCSIYTTKKYSVFGDKGWFWSSSVISDNVGRAWGVNFSYAYVGSRRRSRSSNVRCVPSE
jgi:hypothetical protein